MVSICTSGKPFNPEHKHSSTCKTHLHHIPDTWDKWFTQQAVQHVLCIHLPIPEEPRRECDCSHNQGKRKEVFHLAS